jgi:DNA-binding NarL/FixJ family response regulator
MSTKTETGTIRILVVDPHPLVREGLKLIVRDQDNIFVVGQAATLSQALKFLDEEEPSLITAEIALDNDGGGMELIKKAHLHHPYVWILVLSLCEEEIYAERCLHAGARGYLNKGEPCHVIIQAIRQVSRGQVFLSERMSSRLLARLVDPAGTISEIDSLSDRELQIFEMLGRGLSSVKIASILRISVKTVCSHRANIKKKLKVVGSSELIRVAIQWLKSR